MKKVSKKLKNLSEKKEEKKSYEIKLPNSMKLSFPEIHFVHKLVDDTLGLVEKEKNEEHKEFLDFLIVLHEKLTFVVKNSIKDETDNLD